MADTPCYVVGIGGQARSGKDTLGSYLLQRLNGLGELGAGNGTDSPIMSSGSPEQTQQLLDLGARLICHGADIIMVRDTLAECSAASVLWVSPYDNWLGEGSRA